VAQPGSRRRSAGLENERRRPLFEQTHAWGRRPPKEERLFIEECEAALGWRRSLRARPEANRLPAVCGRSGSDESESVWHGHRGRSSGLLPESTERGVELSVLEGDGRAGWWRDLRGTVVFDAVDSARRLLIARPAVGARNGSHGWCWWAPPPYSRSGPCRRRALQGEADAFTANRDGRRARPRDRRSIERGGGPKCLRTPQVLGRKRPLARGEALRSTKSPPRRFARDSRDLETRAEPRSRFAAVA